MLNIITGIMSNRRITAIAPALPKLRKLNISLYMRLAITSVEKFPLVIT